MCSPFRRKFRALGRLRDTITLAIWNVIDRDVALAHHLLKIAVAHPIAAIPSDRPEHDLTLKVTIFEV